MMALRLIIEHAPAPQPETERLLEAGDLSIGRGAECDWRIEDPEMFVSRKHCVISGEDGRFQVTDASRGGLFLDGADTPLGAGNSAALEHGMRLRLGDVVIRAEVVGARTAAEPPARPPELGGDDFFARRPQPEPPARPQGLPEPFETGRPSHAGPADRDRPAPPPAFDDPFTLDPVRTPAAGASGLGASGLGTSGLGTASPDAGFSFGDFFADAPAPAKPAPAPVPTPAPDPAPAPAAEAPRVRERGQGAARMTWDDAGTDAPPATGPVAGPVAAPPPPAAAPASATAPADPGDDALRRAFLRGLGLDPASLAGSADPVAEMEALGRRFRLLAEGLVQLLRIRAQEKQSVRVAQTVIGASEVNPLKFLATLDESIAALVAPRGKGYLPPEDAITGAFRDLTDHQLRTWTGLQTALRAMIDRFDPARFEADVEEAGVVRSLLSGSRGARLWQLYSERYREIARAAEDRFLGEVGADFRDSYEGARRSGHDDR